MHVTITIKVAVIVTGSRPMKYFRKRQVLNTITVGCMCWDSACYSSISKSYSVMTNVMNQPFVCHANPCRCTCFFASNNRFSGYFLGLSIGART
uniref:Secreted protein n=1 Tax=Heterorhabditis bacteriophora TaxID=37862 RepID=A0A1I7XV98_HETBA